jgi:quercetin dioxygenase-like cupin family protein
MNGSNKPELLQLNAGDSFKVIQITGKAGMKMPVHRSTKKAVVIVQEGTAILYMYNTEYKLSKGDYFLIPANENHSLQLKTDFEAIGVLTLDSTIEFEQ